MIWKDRYNLGNDLIDAQHQELFRRVSDFMDILRSAKSWDERVDKVNETLEFMKEYVVTHFHDEEKYQQQIGYPGYDMHKKTHDDMVNYVVDFDQKYKQHGYDEKLVQQFGGKLLAWLIHHVAAEDQKIAEYARKMGGSN